MLTHLRFQVEGVFADAAGTRMRGLHDPGDYGPSWAYGTRARAADLQGVHYRCVRREGGRCLAVFTEEALNFLGTQQGAVVLEWDGTASRRIA